MKLNGRVANVNVVTEVFFREGQEPLEFRATAIVDGSDFSKYVPDPTPPSVKRPGEEYATPDYTDPKYLKEVNKRVELQSYWMIIRSLEATPGLAWEKVKIDDPKTWKYVDEELKDFGLSNVEKQKLVTAVSRANSLDERFIERAKERFTRSQQVAKVVTSSQADEPSNTKSGEPAKN